MNSQIRAEAAEWLIRFSEAEVDASAREQFNRWLRTSPEHVRAYLRMSAFWQEVDRTMRALSPNFDDPSLIAMEWPQLKRDLEALTATPAEWATNVRKDLAAVDAAVAANDPPKLRRALELLHSNAARRFFRVDRDLKAQCGELGEVGKPLAQIVEALA